MNNFTNELDDICSYLIFTYPYPNKMDIYTLFGNFSVLDTLQNRSLIDSLIPGISNQLIMSKCAFAFLLAQQVII